MSITFTADQINRIREGARNLEEQSAAHEEQLEILVATAEADVRRATMALSQCHTATQSDVARLEIALNAQLRRNEDGLVLARRLCVAARQAHLAASRVELDLRGSIDADRRTEGRTLRHAVLVVDDHEDSRELMSTELHDAGFLVRTASNGLEAVIAAYEMRPAVIVMDVMMPVLDGVEATRLIKAIDAIRDARVIAYTGRPELDDDIARELFARIASSPCVASNVCRRSMSRSQTWGRRCVSSVRYASASGPSFSKCSRCKYRLARLPDTAATWSARCSGRIEPSPGWNFRSCVTSNRPATIRTRSR